MPRVHNIAALLKRWLMGTHQGGVQHYISLLPRRVRLPVQPPPVKSESMLFHRLAHQAVAVGPATYDTIVGNV